MRIKELQLSVDADKRFVMPSSAYPHFLLLHVEDGEDHRDECFPLDPFKDPAIDVRQHFFRRLIHVGRELNHSLDLRHV